MIPQNTATEIIANRRFTMIAAFIQAAKFLLVPILKNIDGFGPLETEPTGEPKPPKRQEEIFINMHELDRARVMGSSCVASSNLGYALEQTFKLMKYCETGLQKSWSGQSGHSLPLLFKALESETQKLLSDIYRNVKFHDFQFEEAINTKFPKEKVSMRDTGDLFSQLQYWQQKKLLQGSRYKYIDATPTGSIVQVLIPYRTVRFLDEVLTEVLALKLKFGERVLDYSVSPFQLED